MKNINNLNHLKEKRRLLRNNGTPAEATLWKGLKAKQLGVRFRRQFSVGNYVLDFYCHSQKLAIELDGDYHSSEQQVQKDFKREEYLNSVGIIVMRFHNDEVRQNVSAVLERIREEIGKLPPSIPPNRGKA